jgi:hypothetical protein
MMPSKNREEPVGSGKILGGGLGEIGFGELVKEDEVVVLV